MNRIINNLWSEDLENSIKYIKKNWFKKKKNLDKNIFIYDKNGFLFFLLWILKYSHISKHKRTEMDSIIERRWGRSVFVFHQGSKLREKYIWF